MESSRNGTKAKNKEQETPDQTKALTVPSSKLTEMTAREIVTFVMSKINSKNTNKEEIAMLREAMKLMPEIAAQVGNVAYHVQRQLIESMSSNVVVEDAIMAEVERLQNELGYQDAPQIEKLLIQQIGMAWLLLQTTQRSYNSSVLGGGISLPLAEWHEKRLTMVQGRYLHAVEMLAKVRKLSKVTPVQINVAQQQINAAIAG